MNKTGLLPRGFTREASHPAHEENDTDIVIGVGAGDTAYF